MSTCSMRNTQKKTRKKFKLANIFLVKQTQIIMLFKLEMESLDFRQWQNKREKGPMKSMVRQKSTQPCKREREKNQRNPKDSPYFRPVRSMLRY